MKADSLPLKVGIYLADYTTSSRQVVRLTFTVLHVFISALFYDATCTSIYTASNDNMAVKNELECGSNQSCDNLHLPSGTEETTESLSAGLWDEF
jgi:hypothetical protein